MRIPLTPIDYYFLRRRPFTTKYVFEYLGRLDFSRFSENLSETIEVFPAVSSRMKFISGQEVLLETGWPVPVTKDVSNIEVGISKPEDIDKFLTPIQNVQDEPMMAFHVTYTPTRTFVGFSFNHIIGDATSRSLFLSALSAVCLGNSAPCRPSDRRDLLRLGNGNFAEPRKSLFAATGYTIPNHAPPASGILETIRYTARELDKIKSDFKVRGASSSTNDIVMATLAKRFHRDVPLYEGKFIIRCPVNYRKILDLSVGYFGNAILDALAIFDDGEVEKLPVEEVALRIRQAIADVNVERIRHSLQCLNSLREKEGVQVFDHVGRPGLIVTNITMLPIDKYDFGLGPPTDAHMMSLTPGVGIIMPSKDGIEVRFKRPI